MTGKFPVSRILKKKESITVGRNNPATLLCRFLGLIQYCSDKHDKLCCSCTLNLRSVRFHFSFQLINILLHNVHLASPYHENRAQIIGVFFSFISKSSSNSSPCLELSPVHWICDGNHSKIITSFGLYIVLQKWLSTIA